MPAPVAISVVIPTYNRREILSRTLPTIWQQDFPPDQYEVIVVVDGSTDGTAAMLRSLNPPCAFRVLEQPNRGQAAARNAGWRAARGELILFLDDDMQCNRSLIREHASAHDCPEPLVIFGPVPLSLDSLDSPATQAWQANSDAVLSRLSRHPEPLWPDDIHVGSNASLPRSILARCGGFDESFSRMYEDTELGLRLWKMGVRFRYQPLALACHLYLKSPDELVSDKFWKGKHDVLLSRKHPEYRPYAYFARQPNGALWKRAARSLAARFPQPAEPVMRLAFRLTNVLPSGPLMRRIANRLDGWRGAISYFRGAVEVAGSWDSLQREFGMKLPAREPRVEVPENHWPFDEASRMVATRQRKVVLKHFLKRIPLLPDAYRRVKFLSSIAYQRWCVNTRERMDRLNRERAWNFESPLEQGRHQCVLAAITRLWGTDRWNNVLEVGCSDGVFTARPASYCGALTACDISGAACARVAERCAGFPHVRIACLNLNQDEIPGNYDLVFAMDVLECLHGRKALEQVVRKLAGVLRNGGFLVFSGCRLPANLRSWSLRRLPEGADNLISFLSAGFDLKLLHREYYPPEAVAGYPDHAIAIFEKIHAGR